MRRLIILGLSVVSTAAYAQPAGQPGAPAAAATEVSGVTVTARRSTRVEEVNVQASWCPKIDPVRHPATTPPRVVSTYPAQNATVTPGVLTLSVTFDQPMSCSWAMDYEIKGQEPCQAEGGWVLPARTTWRVRCNVRSKTEYEISFGDDDGFVALSGLPAAPYGLRFSTSDGRPVGSEAARAALDPDAPQASAEASVVVCEDDGPLRRGRCRHIRPTAPDDDPAAPPH